MASSEPARRHGLPAGAATAPRAPSQAPDVRDVLFAPLAGRSFAFEITTTEPAVVAGSQRLLARAEELGLDVESIASDGDRLVAGAALFRARGDAWQVSRAEEQLLGPIGKASGVATAAAALVDLASGRARVVCGAWKKVPAEVRTDLRQAIAVGGAGIRMLDRPFVYLDKNHVRMLGGAGRAVRQARQVEARAVVVQLRGELAPIAEEAREAAAAGADMLMIDTGRLDDLAAVARCVRGGRAARAIGLGFGGGVRAETLLAVVAAGADVVDVGRAILDAPLVDFRLDVK